MLLNLMAANNQRTAKEANRLIGKLRFQRVHEFNERGNLAIENAPSAVNQKTITWFPTWPRFQWTYVFRAQRSLSMRFRQLP